MSDRSLPLATLQRETATTVTTRTRPLGLFAQHRHVVAADCPVPVDRRRPSPVEDAVGAAETVSIRRPGRRLSAVRHHTTTLRRKRLPAGGGHCSSRTTNSAVVASMSADLCRVESRQFTVVVVQRRRRRVCGPSTVSSSLSSECHRLHLAFQRRVRLTRSRNRP